MKKVVHRTEALWTATMYLAAGEKVVTHRHKFDHDTLLTAGCIRVTVGDRSAVHYAPAMVTIRAGENHEILAIRDSVATCIHALAPGETIEDAVLDTTADLMVEHARLVVPPQRAF